MKAGDEVQLRDGRKGFVVASGFRDFIALEDGVHIYTINHLVETYTSDLNHKNNKNMDIIILNGEKVHKRSLEEKLGIMSEIGNRLKL